MSELLSQFIQVLGFIINIPIAFIKQIPHLPTISIIILILVVSMAIIRKKYY